MNRIGEPHVFIELRPLAEGCHAKVHVEGAPDGLPRIYVGSHAAGDEAAREPTGWAHGWLRRFREKRPCLR